MAKIPGAPLPGSVTFSEQELADIEREAMDLELAASKKGEKAKLVAAARKRARQKLLPEEMLRPVIIDLAPYSDRVTLDGVAYMQAATYQVTQSVYDSLAEVMQRTWTHEAAVSGANSNGYRRPLNTQLNGRTGAVANAPLTL